MPASTRTCLVLFSRLTISLSRLATVTYRTLLLSWNPTCNAHALGLDWEVLPVGGRCQ